MVTLLVRLMMPMKVLVAEAGDQERALLWRLAPQQQALVLMALLGLIAVGIGLVALVLVGGQRLRRIARQRFAPMRSAEDEWYRKPLVPREQDGGTTATPGASGPSEP